MAFFSQLPGETGGMFIGPAGSCFAVPYAGNGRTIWYGGMMKIIGAPPQIVDKNNMIIAEAIVGFDGEAQFFRPPHCNFPVGQFPNLRLMLSVFVEGKIIFSTEPSSIVMHSKMSDSLFINSQKRRPAPYQNPNFNHVLNENTSMRCTRVNEGSETNFPPIFRRSELRPRL